MSTKDDLMGQGLIQTQKDTLRLSQRFWFFIYTYLLKPSSLGVLVLALIITLGLFIKPIIGMGDDGSTAEVLAGSNLYNLGELDPKESMAYFQKNWGIMEYFNESQNIQVTSQTPLIDIAVKLDTLFTWDYIFDVQFYTGLTSLFFLFAMYLFFEAVTNGLRAPRAYVIVAIGVFIFGDTAYTAWFNSFYPQGILYFSCMMVAVPMLLLGQKRVNDYFLLALFFFNAILLIFSNQQNTLLGIILGVLGMMLMLNNPKKIFKRLCLWGGGLLFFLSLLGFFFMPGNKTNINAFHSMTQGVLMTAENPQEALAFFGIDPQYAILTGTTYYQAISPETMNSVKMKTNFFDRFNPTKIAVYYFGNPGQFYEMMDLSIHSSFNMRPSWLGNYEITQGYGPGAQTNYFTLWSHIKANNIPGNFGFIIIWMGVVIATFVRTFRKGLKEKNYRKSMEFLGIITWILIGLWQLYASVITTGNIDTSGRLFIFSVIFDLVSYVLLGKFIFWLGDKILNRDWNRLRKWLCEKKALEKIKDGGVKE